MSDSGWLCSHGQARRWLAEYESALDALLLYARDQLGHLEARSAPGALYVGRRLDQAWRRLEWAGMQWLDTPWVHVVVASVDGSKVAFPPALALMTPTDSIEAGEAARVSLLATGSCLAATPLEPVAVAASLHAARLSFSAYRLNKSRGYVRRRPESDPPTSGGRRRRRATAPGNVCLAAGSTHQELSRRLKVCARATQ